MSETRTVHVDDFTVTVAGDLVAGRDARLTLSVIKDGKPVTDLEPYLGAYGHLVALREGDLAYLHVHPDGEPGDGRTGPDPRSSSTPPCRVPARTGSSSTSSTTAWCAPPRSPSPQARRRPRGRPRRRTTTRPHRTTPEMTTMTTTPTTKPGAAGLPPRLVDRARDHRDDLRLLRQPDRAQAQQARGRHRDRQLRHREGEGRLPGQHHHR